MNVRTTFTWAALALVAGSALAPNGQAETVTPKVAEAVPLAVEEVSEIRIPDSRLSRDAAQVIRDNENDLLFQHSMRVYYWAALAGKRKGLHCRAAERCRDSLSASATIRGRLPAGPLRQPQAPS
ncbi:hypothetical protein ACT4MK_00060 (plasmid) [Bradyrhizobium barranii]|uniref:hypothetical protein n=1 Tax=Bradyrhizobium TaxID=374 RepID=UPI0033962945